MGLRTSKLIRCSGIAYTCERPAGVPETVIPPVPEWALSESGIFCLLVEVTSASIEITDRREKLLVYKRIAILRAPGA